MLDVVVVGAGPAGLTAALLAAEAGHAVTLIEASDRLGGMSASTTVSGQRVDLGSHRLHPSASPEVRALLDRLLGDDLQTRSRNGRIRIGGRWVRFPLSTSDLARTLPPRFVVAAGRDALVSPLRRPKRDTYDEVVRAGLGPAVLTWFYGPYAKKLWGVDARELHGDIARRRIAVSSPLELVSKLFRAATAGPPIFLYPRHGYGQVVDELVAAAKSAGVRILNRTRVVDAVLPDEAASPTQPRSPVLLRTDAAQSELWADRVLWTAAPHHLLGIVSAAPELRGSRSSGLGTGVLDGTSRAVHAL